MRESQLRCHHHESLRDGGITAQQLRDPGLGENDPGVRVRPQRVRELLLRTQAFHVHAARVQHLLDPVDAGPQHPVPEQHQTEHRSRPGRRPAVRGAAAAHIGEKDAVLAQVHPSVPGHAAIVGAALLARPPANFRAWAATAAW
ncbi:hypothetical protein [Streptomyces sp. NPDC055642]